MLFRPLCDVHRQKEHRKTHSIALNANCRGAHSFSLSVCLVWCLPKTLAIVYGCIVSVYAKRMQKAHSWNDDPQQFFVPRSHIPIALNCALGRGISTEIWFALGYNMSIKLMLKPLFSFSVLFSPLFSGTFFSTAIAAHNIHVQFAIDLVVRLQFEKAATCCKNVWTWSMILAIIKSENIIFYFEWHIIYQLSNILNVSNIRNSRSDNKWTTFYFIRWVCIGENENESFVLNWMRIEPSYENSKVRGGFFGVSKAISSVQYIEFEARWLLAPISIATIFFCANFLQLYH